MRQHFQSIRQALSWEWPRILENGFHQMKNWKHEHRSERFRRTKSLLMRYITKRANRNDEPEDKHGTKTQLHIKPLLLTALQEIDDEKPASVSNSFNKSESKPRMIYGKFYLGENDRSVPRNDDDSDDSFAQPRNHRHKAKDTR